MPKGGGIWHLKCNPVKGIYHDKMLGNATKNFADMVVSGELIESSIKNGLVEENSGSKKVRSVNKKKRRSLSRPCGILAKLCFLSILPRLCTTLPFCQQCCYQPLCFLATKTSSSTNSSHEHCICNSTSRKQSALKSE